MAFAATKSHKRIRFVIYLIEASSNKDVFSLTNLKLVGKNNPNIFREKWNQTSQLKVVTEIKKI